MSKCKQMSITAPPSSWGQFSLCFFSEEESNLLWSTSYTTIGLEVSCVLIGWTCTEIYVSISLLDLPEQMINLVIRWKRCWLLKREDQQQRLLASTCLFSSIGFYDCVFFTLQRSLVMVSAWRGHIIIHIKSTTIHHVANIHIMI